MKSEQPYYDPIKQEYVYETSDVEPLVGKAKAVNSSSEQEPYYIASIVLLVLGFFFTGILWLISGVVFQNKKYGPKTRTIAKVSLIFFVLQSIVIAFVCCGTFVVWIIAMIAAGTAPLPPSPVVPSAS